MSRNRQNAEVSTALGLEVPQRYSSRADEVIDCRKPLPPFRDRARARKTSNSGRCIDHRLLVISDEPAAGSVPIDPAGPSCSRYSPPWRWRRTRKFSRHGQLEDHMSRYLKILAALNIGLLAALLGHAQPASAQAQNAVMAIDTLLEPDETMIKEAVAANERLLKVFPKGFALGTTHAPHISTLQRYVKTADLDKVYEAVGKVLAEDKPTGWKLKAYKYYYIPWKDIGLAGIVIEPTGDLIRFQKKLIDALAPFTVKTGTAAAFVTTKEDPDINQPTIDYVEHFVPNETGKKFNPHVTIGLASQVYLEGMLKEPFEAFTFSPAGLSVYHLGNFGTARTKLKSWDLGG